MRPDSVRRARHFFGGCTIAFAVFAGAFCGDRKGPPPSTGAAAADVDDDGIPDALEDGGIDYEWQPDKSNHHLDLKQLGASPTHKDIVVWVVWMAAADHVHRPEPAAIDVVTKAFDSAPVSNPDKRPGINLHVVYAPSPIPEKTQIGELKGDDYDWSEFEAMRPTYVPAAFGNVVFFCLFAHFIDVAQHSGVARLPGRDLIVSLGGSSTNHVGNTNEQAGTFMHELGHALGLHHGGRDDLGSKPNYMSVMNYFFQMEGLRINGRPGNFSFSTFTLAAHESSLTEKSGLSTDPALSVYSTFYVCPNGQGLKAIRAASGEPIDWNCDGKLDTTVAADVNDDQTVSDLDGASDWSNIVLKPPTAASAGVALGVPSTKLSRELTMRDADRIPLFPVTDVHAAQVGASVMLQWQPVPLDRVRAYNVYRSEGGRDVPLGTVDNTPTPSFVDTPPTKGAVGYTVTAVYTPHASEPEAPPPPPPPPPAAPGPRRPTLGAPLFRVIALPNAVQQIREHSPTQSGRMETMGLVLPKSLAEVPVLKFLLETQRSAPATVVVK